MNGALAAAGLTHRFGALGVLDEVTLTLAPGELVALVGPTGCGKSTLLRILAGLVKPTAGRAAIDGMSVIRAPGAAAYMPQAGTLLPWRSALANATLGAELRGTEPGEARERGRAAFARFGLAGFEEAWPSTLSGGMAQRVALLRTVLTDAAVLLLDEPFGALDAMTREDLHRWFADLLATTRRSVILVTHDIDEALVLADRIVVMSPRPGRILADVVVPTRRPRRHDDLVQQSLRDVRQAVRARLGRAESG